MWINKAASHRHGRRSRKVIDDVSTAQRKQMEGSSCDAWLETFKAHLQPSDVFPPARLDLPSIP